MHANGRFETKDSSRGKFIDRFGSVSCETKKRNRVAIKEEPQRKPIEIFIAGERVSRLLLHTSESFPDESLFFLPVKTLPRLFSLDKKRQGTRNNVAFLFQVFCQRGALESDRRKKKKGKNEKIR